MKCLLVTSEKDKTGLWILKGKCPWCGEIHTHGGGYGDIPSLGHRQGHCIEVVDTGGYMLRFDMEHYVDKVLKL